MIFSCHRQFDLQVSTILQKVNSFHDKKLKMPFLLIVSACMLSKSSLLDYSRVGLYFILLSFLQYPQKTQLSLSTQSEARGRNLRTVARSKPFLSFSSQPIFQSTLLSLHHSTNTLQEKYHCLMHILDKLR